MTGKTISIPPVINPVIRGQLDVMYKHFKKAPKMDTERRCYYCHEWGDMMQMRSEYRINKEKRYIHFACYFKKFSKKF